MKHRTTALAHPPEHTFEPIPDGAHQYREANPPGETEPGLAIQTRYQCTGCNAVQVITHRPRPDGPNGATTTVTIEPGDPAE